MLRPQREHLHMFTAHMWARRSTCKRKQQGAVITNADMTSILSIGYNGPAKGLSHNACRGTEGTCGCPHCEGNAIAKVTSSEREKTIFVTTMPCELCAQLIVNSGITRVFYSWQYRDTRGIEILRACQILVSRCIPDIDQVLDNIHGLANDALSTIGDECLRQNPLTHENIMKIQALSCREKLLQWIPKPQD